MAKKQRKQIEYNNVIYNTAFEEVMHNSMLPYSESVILDRALPRVEDGLKPVQRRILYSMHEMGLTPEKPHKKSARIVGDCMGKYHPHGDSSVYGAMVRMAQSFAMRMKLVDGHGNFGSVDGDSAAAMRYTEARMSPLALELLRDLDKDTVSWNTNFDDSLQEPMMLPGRFPNLLVNGASGIAVGLATNIPPHNMAESIDAVIAMIDNPKITVAELLSVFKGPDFPTGGFIIPIDTIQSIYETGRGRIKIRSRLHIEDEGNGKKAIVITEMPYQVSKADLLIKIADLREKNKDILSVISEIVDESDKTGMRAVIRCKKETDVNKVIAFLFKKSNLEVNYSLNIVAIACGKPEQLGLCQILRHYIAYQKQVIVRRTSYDLKCARARSEIVNGLLIAISNIDEVIRIIRQADSTQKAKLTLRERFDLSDEQAQAILDMRLKALARLEVSRLEAELSELQKKIDYLTSILNSDRKQYNVIKQEILEIKSKMSTGRLSVILSEEANGDIDIPTEMEAVDYREGVLVSNSSGTLRFMSQKSYVSAQKDMSIYGENELPTQALTVNNKGTLYVFTNLGNVVKVNVTDLPEKRWKDKGITLGSICQEIKLGEYVKKMLFFNSTPLGELILFSKNGMAKRTDLNEFATLRQFSNAKILADGDELINVEVVEEDTNILQVTKGGQCLVYKITDIPLQGRKAGGVRGIKLNDKDTVVFGGQFEEEGEVVVITTTGHTKRVISSTLDVSSRYLKGIKICELAPKSEVIFVDTVKMPYNLAIISQEITHILDTESIRIDVRTTKGRQLFKNKIDKVIKLDNEFN